MDRDSAFNKLMTESKRHLNLYAGNRTFSGFFVGSKTQEYLIVEVPRSAEIDACLTGQEVVFGSFCTSGQVIRFESSIMAFFKKPAWLLFLTYPISIENTHSLRTSQRTECNIPCVLATLANLKQYTGIITNISAGGCKCSLSRLSLGQAKLFNPKIKVVLEFSPADGYGKERVFAEVTNAKREGTELSLGIKFSGNYGETTLNDLVDYLPNTVK